MLLQVLGTAADAGRWYIVNATPDIGDQIEDTPALHPGPGARQTPVAGVVLTDAELDHTLGVARLREADGVELVATAPVREALLAGPRLGAVLGPYTELLWRELGTAPLPLGPELEAAAVPIAAKRPRYAAGTGDDDPHWVVALVLREPSTGKTLVYGPALAAWPQALQEAAEAADCVIVDGTFWDEDEPVRTGISTRTASGMGHLPIDGSAGTAHRLTGLPARCLYTHLNNTNPLTDPDDDRHKQLADRGLEVAADGMVIEL
ncbi:MBL fold metallo-hydrolase [Streptomyces phaeochromogenes]|uniref:pyrroloquinoline quinone biosynthesis protein PqqB n=1 Tax=Streptomyces phaeochromogenes TaxID=1923 RepID=UPI00324D105D